MDYIKTQPTLYNRKLFSSKLKARWAVFFDNLPIEWVYKPNGKFPDFWLPQVHMWAEVRPVDFTNYDYGQAFKLVTETKYALLMLIGNEPKYRPYYALEYHTNGEVVKCMHPYVLSNYHNYPTEEHRFYFCCGDNLKEEGAIFSDTVGAIHISRRIDFAP